MTKITPPEQRQPLIPALQHLRDKTHEALAAIVEMTQHHTNVLASAEVSPSSSVWRAASSYRSARCSVTTPIAELSPLAVHCQITIYLQSRAYEYADDRETRAVANRAQHPAA